MRITNITVALAAALCTTAHAQDFDLKGYRLGAEQPTCPPGTVSEAPRGRQLMCLMGPTTLANQPVKNHSIVLFEGKIIGMQYLLEAKGQYANSELREALQLKFGAPTSSKSHVNEYTWRAGDNVLRFDGWKGSVAAFDMAANRRASADGAQQNKSDL